MYSCHTNRIHRAQLAQLKRYSCGVYQQIDICKGPRAYRGVNYLEQRPQNGQPGSPQVAYASDRDCTASFRLVKLCCVDVGECLIVYRQN